MKPTPSALGPHALVAMSGMHVVVPDTLCPSSAGYNDAGIRTPVLHPHRSTHRASQLILVHLFWLPGLSQLTLLQTFKLNLKFLLYLCPLVSSAWSNCLATGRPSASRAHHHPIPTFHHKDGIREGAGLNHHALHVYKYMQTSSIHKCIDIFMNIWPMAADHNILLWALATVHV